MYVDKISTLLLMLYGSKYYNIHEVHVNMQQSIILP